VAATANGGGQAWCTPDAVVSLRELDPPRPSGEADAPIQGRGSAPGRSGRGPRNGARTRWAAEGGKVVVTETVGKSRGGATPDNHKQRIRTGFHMHPGHGSAWPRSIPSSVGGQPRPGRGDMKRWKVASIAGRVRSRSTGRQTAYAFSKGSNWPCRRQRKEGQEGRRYRERSYRANEERPTAPSTTLAFSPGPADCRLSRDVRSRGSVGTRDRGSREGATQHRQAARTRLWHIPDWNPRRVWGGGNVTVWDYDLQQAGKSTH